MSLSVSQGTAMDVCLIVSQHMQSWVQVLAHTCGRCCQTQPYLSVPPHLYLCACSWVISAWVSPFRHKVTAMCVCTAARVHTGTCGWVCSALCAICAWTVCATAALNLHSSHSGQACHPRPAFPAGTGHQSGVTIQQKVGRGQRAAGLTGAPGGPEGPGSPCSPRRPGSPWKKSWLGLRGPHRHLSRTPHGLGGPPQQLSIVETPPRIGRSHFDSLRHRYMG